MAVEQQMMGVPTCSRENGTCSELGAGDRRVQHRTELAASVAGKRGRDLGWRGHLGSEWTAAARSPGLVGRSCCMGQDPAVAYRTWSVEQQSGRAR